MAFTEEIKNWMGSIVSASPQKDEKGHASTHVMLPAYLPPAMSLSNHALLMHYCSYFLVQKILSVEAQVCNNYQIKFPSISTVQSPKAQVNLHHGTLSMAANGPLAFRNSSTVPFSIIVPWIGVQFGSLKAGNKAAIPQKLFPKIASRSPLWIPRPGQSSGLFPEITKMPNMSTKPRQPNPHVTTGSEAKGASRSKSQTS